MHSLLEGVRVLDLGRGHAGPYCAKLFADAGADVIHVERPGDGDPSRRAGPFAPADADQEFSASFAFLNAGKQSVTLDYTTEGGARLLRDLVAKSDILVENGPPGTLASRGFSLEQLHAVNPALVVISITNYGQTGPYRDIPATEMTLQAASGLMDGNGELGRPPLRYPMNIAQHWAGSNGAYSGLAAYWHAMMTGQGQQVDVSIQESLATTWYLVWADYQYTGSLQARGQKDLVPAADGQLMIRWQTSVPWEEFAIAMDAMELLTDPQLQPPANMGPNAGLFQDAIAVHTATLPRREWMERAIAHEIPAGMLQSLDDVAACEQNESRSFWDRLATPWGEARFPGTYYQVEGEARGGELRCVPSLGEHNEAVYGGLLGLDSAELARLAQEGAI